MHTKYFNNFQKNNFDNFLKLIIAFFGIDFRPFYISNSSFMTII